MERLTKKENIQMLKDIKYKSSEMMIYEKLGEYENSEEQGLLKMLPVAIGSDVYYIPSKTNYELNVLGKHEEHNRVYHQKVARIGFTENGWYIECSLNLQYGITDLLRDKTYKETWFTSEEEAEAALAKMVNS